MRTIDAAVLDGPESIRIETLELADPQRDEVLVDVRAVGVCHTDIHQYLGDGEVSYPVVLGHEAAGVVRETGPGVSGLDPGDHVVLAVITHCGRCPACERGQPYHCENDIDIAFGGGLVDGTRRLSVDGEPVNHFFAQSSFATSAVVPAQTAVRVPDDVPFAPAALLGCGASTGIGAVLNTAGVEPGASVAVFGTGGVGASALLGARAVGATPRIAVDVVPAKLDAAADLGATHTVDASETDPVERVRELTDGGAAYTFECLGAPEVMEQTVAAAREGGTATLVGAHHGGETFAVDPWRDMLPGGKTVRGCVAGSMRPAVDIPRYVAMYRDGLLELDALVSARYELAEVESALQDAMEGTGFRTVLTVD
jgi:Zn-dependent alcohol dehydrogenase